MVDAAGREMTVGSDAALSCAKCGKTARLQYAFVSPSAALFDLCVCVCVWFIELISSDYGVFWSSTGYC